jgi:hypothetical protein
VAVGDVMVGGTVSRVEASLHACFAVGDSLRQYAVFLTRRAGTLAFNFSGCSKVISLMISSPCHRWLWASENGACGAKRALSEHAAGRHRVGGEAIPQIDEESIMSKGAKNLPQALSTQTLGKKPTLGKDVQTFADAFDALADTPDEAANLRARADLMDALSALVAACGRQVHIELVAT